MYYIVSANNITLTNEEAPASPKKKLVRELLKDDVITIEEATLLLDGEDPTEPVYNPWTTTTTEDFDYTLTY